MNELIYVSSEPGDDAATDVLKRLAGFHPGGRLRAVVAWASRGGVERLAEAVGDTIADLQLVIGGNSGSSEVDAPLRLRELGATCHVVFYNEADIFHPKTFWFDQGPGPQLISALSGSPNLTDGGLFANHENLIGFTLDRHHINLAADAIARFEQAWVFLTDPTNDIVHPANSDEELRLLYQNGLLVSTQAARRRRRRDTRITARTAGRPRTVPTRESARAGRGRSFDPLQVPFPLDSEPEDVEIVRRPAPQGGQRQRGRSPAVGTRRFYVRTLTGNDVRKLLGLQSGTFEPDLGITPRDLAPDFWHWPQDYVTIHRTAGKPPRDEYTATARLITPLTVGGEIVNLRLWFRPYRPGHAAEHRIGVVQGQGAVNIRDYVPPNFDTTGIFVIEEAPLSGQEDYVVRLLRPGDADYAKYSAALTHQNPGHRYGYGVCP